MGKREYTDEEKANFRSRDNELAKRVTDALADEAVAAQLREQLTGVAESVRRLSFRNQVLLLLQAIDRGFEIQDVDTYWGWRARGRKVMRHAESLRRVRPVEGRSNQVDHTAAEEKAKKRMGFRTDAVFDISQTEPIGDDAATQAADEPELHHRSSVDSSATNSEAERYDALVDQAQKRGYQIDRTEHTARIDVIAHTIYVPGTLTEQDAATTLCRLLAVIDHAAEPATTLDGATGPRARGSASEAFTGVDEGGLPDVERGGERHVSLPLGGYFGTAVAHVTTNKNLGRTRYQPRPGPSRPEPSLRDQPHHEHPVEYGPHWPYVADLIARADTLTADARRSLQTFKDARDPTAVRAAKRAVVALAVEAERDEAFRLAWHSPAGSGAVALMLRDVLPALHYEVLTEPWTRLVGPLHPDDIGSDGSR